MVGFFSLSKKWVDVKKDNTILKEEGYVHVETKVVQDAQQGTLFHRISMLALSELGGYVRVESILEDYSPEKLYFRFKGKDDNSWLFERRFSLYISSDEDPCIKMNSQVIHDASCDGSITPHLIHLSPAIRKESSLVYSGREGHECGFECPSFGKSN